MRLAARILAILWSLSASAGVSPWIPFDSTGGHISIPVTLNEEQKVWLMLDTGNSTGIFMPRKLALRYDWLEEFSTEEMRVSGVNIVSDSVSFNLPEITLGPYTLENVILVVPAEGERTTIGKKENPQLG